MESHLKPLTRIPAFYAFLSVDPADGTEGIVSWITQGPNGTQYAPLITGYPDRLPGMIEAARKIAQHSGRKLTLAKFTARKDMEEII